MKKQILLQMLFASILLITISQKSNAQQTLIHYWHFNNFTSTSSIPVNPSTLTPLLADSSIIRSDTAKVMYRVQPGTSSAYLTYWDMVTPGDTTNARYGTLGGNGLRPRNPWDSMQLVWIIPSNGFKNLTIKFGCQKSGSGPQVENFEYSIDGGTTWTNSGLSITSFVVTATGNPNNLVTITMSDANTFNNKNLQFRIRFTSNSTPPVTGGNNRVDNFTVEGDPMPSGPPMYNIGQINTTNPTTGVADSLNGHFTLRGLVYGFNQRTPSAGTQFLLRDNTGGVTVFHVSKTFGYTVAEGDSVVVPGIVQTYRGLIEFAPDTIIKVGSAKTIKIPTVITTLVEANENDLVKMNNLMFYATPTGGVWPAASANVLCHTQNLTDTIIVRVLTGSALAGAPLPTASLFNIVGMVQQFSTSSAAPYAFNGYEILPRTTSDVISGLAPPDAVTSVNATPNLTSLTFSWTNPVTYNSSTMKTVVFIKTGSAITLGTPNKNSTAYTANTTLGSGSAFQNDANANCVMNSNNNTVTVTGLTQSTNYYAIIYVIRNADSTYSAAATANSTTTNNLPNPVTSLSVAGLTPTSATISWTRPAGYDVTSHTTLVFVKVDNAITAGTPTNAITSYTANTAFGSGTAYQNDAAAFCVYNGDSASVNVTNLVQGKTYNVIVWVVRNSDSKYATSPTIGSGTALPPAPTAKVIHYWHFNNLNTGMTGAVMATSFYNWGIGADYSTLDTSKAKIYYRTNPGVSNTYVTYWDNVTGDTLNQRFGTAAGLAMRARNPSDSMNLQFYIPTTHYKNIKVSYVCEKSSLASGQYQQNYDYSVDAGATWRTKGLSMTVDSTIGTGYTPVYISFLPTDTFAYNNPNLILRIKFSADPSGTIGLPSGTSGNNRFDNFVVEGDTTTAPPIPLSINNIKDIKSSLVLYPNPTSGELFINSVNDQVKNISVMNITGQVVAQYSDSSKVIKMDISNLNSGLYFVQVRENDQVSTMKLLKN
ncbi:MAG: T9SS type A sorting domain-containing protein [Bacteroidota bacterium]